MFKFVPDNEVPGIRVGLPDDLPGFRIAEDGSVRRGPVPPLPSAVPFGHDPYSNVLQITAPTVLRPARPFYQPGSGLSPTQYIGYVPVSGDSPAPDPLRQAVDRAQVPVSQGLPNDPLRQAVDRAANTNPNRSPSSMPKSEAGAAIGGLMGGLAGIALGGGIGAPFLTPILGTLGGVVGGYAPGAIYGPAGQSLGEVAGAGIPPGRLIVAYDHWATSAMKQ
jgi:hypothetical protein